MPKQFVRQVDDLSILYADGTVAMITAPFHLANAQKVNIWLVATDARLVKVTANVSTNISLSLTLEAPNATKRMVELTPALSSSEAYLGTLSLAFPTDSLNLTAGSYLVAARAGIDQPMRLILPHVYLMVSGSA